MKITIEGVITSIEEKEKEDKKYTDVLIAQKGEKMQVPVRLQGHVAERFDLYQVEAFTGRLLTWKARDGVGMMVTVDDRN